MTRVNSDVAPRVLKRLHLLAEIREITMVPASLRRSLSTIPSDRVLASIPSAFTLNKGHVKFFYNKLTFLQRRFDALASEMERRGYYPDRSRRVAFKGFASIWYNDWESTLEDDDIILWRIADKIKQKPHLYKD